MNERGLIEGLAALVLAVRDLTQVIRLKQHEGGQPVTLKDLQEMEGRIMANQAEVVTRLNALNTQLQKIADESTQTLNKVKELQEAVENQENASPELIAAADALAAQVQKIDDLVPDPSTPPPQPVP